MDKKRIITSKYFRLWDVTNEKIYLPHVILEKLSYSFELECTFFYLREMLHYGAESYLLNLKNKCLSDGTIKAVVSIICGNCKDPRVYDDCQKVASFNIHKIHQIDVANIMAMGPSDIAIVKVLAQVEVVITEKDIKNILQNMDIEDA